jgi:hypothetical protein
MCVRRQSCTESTSAPIDGPPLGACPNPGEYCSGRLCYDDHSGANWEALCCDGQWLSISTDALGADGGVPSCPKAIAPGDAFPCGNGGLTCVAGQTYCRTTSRAGSSQVEYSCEALCSAGDCSCLCPGGTPCNVDPPDKLCADDSCQCDVGRDSLGVRQPATTVLTCSYGPRPLYACVHSCVTDACAPPLSAVYRCEGAGPPSADCMPSFTTMVSGPWCGAQTTYYCCPN